MKKYLEKQRDILSFEECLSIKMEEVNGKLLLTTGGLAQAGQWLA